MQYAPMLRDSMCNTLMGLSDMVGRVVIKPETHERGVILEGNDSVFAKKTLRQSERLQNIRLVQVR